MSRDISSAGSTNKIVANDLDGFYISKELHPKVEMTKIAEKILHEYTSTHFRTILLNVEVVDIEETKQIYASVIGTQTIMKNDILDLEEKIQQALEKPDLSLMVRQIQLELYNKNGRIRYQWAPFENILSVKQKKIFAKAKSYLKSQFKEQDDVFLENINNTFIDGQYCFLLELTGKRYFSDEEVKVLEEKLSHETASPIKIYAWSRPGVVAVSDGYSSYNEITRNFFSKREEKYKVKVEKVLEEIQ